MATDENPQFISVITSPAQCEIAFNFLNAIKELAEKAKELGCELPRFVDYSHEHEIADGGTSAATLVYNDWIDRIEAVLDEKEPYLFYDAMTNRGIRRTMIATDPEVLRLVIDGALADSTTHRVEFEPRADDFERYRMDWIRIVDIEEVEIIEDTVPYFISEEELGRRIFEEEVAKQVLGAITNMTLACIENGPEHRTKGPIEALDKFVVTYAKDDKTSLRHFKKLAYEIANFEVRTAMAAEAAAKAANSGFKPGISKQRFLNRTISDKIMKAAKAADEYRKQGYLVESACDKAKISTGSYYCAMYQLHEAGKSKG